MIKQKGECCPHAHCSDGVFLTSAKTTSLGGGTDIHVNNPGVPQFGQPLFGNGITPPTIGEYIYNNVMTYRFIFVCIFQILRATYRKRLLKSYVNSNNWFKQQVWEPGWGVKTLSYR